MPSYTYKCDECEIEQDVRLTISQMQETTINCPDCEEEMRRLLFSPMVMRVGLPDGTKRKGFSELKEAAKLEVDRANLDPRSTAHKELGKVIKTIKSTK